MKTVLDLPVRSRLMGDLTGHLIVGNNEVAVTVVDDDYFVVLHLSSIGELSFEQECFISRVYEALNAGHDAHAAEIMADMIDTGDPFHDMTKGY